MVDPARTVARMHRAMNEYVDSWRRDPAGPWWEGDLGGQLYGILERHFPRVSPTTLATAPSFLARWRAPLFHRLTAEFHVPGGGKGIYPDFSYRGPQGDGFDWVLELKIASMTRVATSDVQKQASELINYMLDDVRRWAAREDTRYVLSFAAVNAPDVLETRQRGSAQPQSYLRTFLDGVDAVLDQKLQELRAEVPGDTTWDMWIVCKEISGERIRKFDQVVWGVRSRKLYRSTTPGGFQT
ncbi:MAG: hypothetical protein ACE5I7_15800 [Candidatus Binatia bacterium]